MNPWLTKGGLLLGSLAAIATVASLVNLSGQSLYDQPAKEGVLMPFVEAKEKPEPEPPKNDEPIKQRVRFSVETNGALDKSSFKSMTDGVDVRLISAQPIKENRKTEAHQPRSVVLLLDNSFSMNQVTPPSLGGGRQLPESDPDYRRLEASTLLLEALNEESDRVALASFPRRNPFPGQLNMVLMDPEVITEFSPPSFAQSDLESLRGAENSGTPLYRGIDLALSVIEPEDASRSKIIIALTDGRDTEYMDSVPEGMREAVVASGAKLFVVTLGPTPDLVSLNQVADQVISVANSAQLSEAFLEIAEQFEEVITGYNVEMVMDIPDPKKVASREAEVAYRAGEQVFRTKVDIPRRNRE